MLPSSVAHARCPTAQSPADACGSKGSHPVGRSSPPAPAGQPAQAQWPSRRQCLGFCAAQLLAHSCVWAPSAATARVQPPAPLSRSAGGNSQLASPQRIEQPIGLQIADVRQLTEHAEAAARAGDYPQVWLQDVSIETLSSRTARVDRRGADGCQPPGKPTLQTCWRTMYAAARR